MIKTMYSRKLKVISIFLLLSFTQKLGVGLYLHNWLHDNRNYSKGNKTGPGVDQIQINCACIEDALMPLDPSPSTIEIKAPEKYFFSFSNFYHFPTSTVAKLFYGLRGPPAKTV
ncbi:MAG TPA: hypothetical protein VKR32_09080 [Puia sp.]|nr:hypothetical protein [Puia sp.]